MKSVYKEEYKERKECYEVYYSLGMAYFKTDIDKAYTYMNTTLELAGKIYGKSSVESARSYLAIGRIYKALGDPYNAKNNFKVAREIVKVKANQEKLLSEIENELEYYLLPY